MTNQKFSFFRFLLFILGLGIIALAFFLTGNGNERTSIDNFIWVSVVIIYLTVFCPFFFSSLGKRFSEKIPSLTLVWLGVFLYAGVSLAVILILKFSRLLPLNAAIIIQAIVFFLFLINIYFAYFANAHVAQVTADTENLLRSLNDIKAGAASLALKASSGPAGKEDLQKKLNKAAEDIRYISPVAGAGAAGLEQKLINKIGIINEYWDSLLSGGEAPALAGEINNLEMLIKERKLLRNG
jgi:ABC-type transport system involved in cytochrome bd biosynthesis fused ATPase/permease subunit